jgi:DNA-directed RNA polymerase subunit N (RpoN/RPB10)
VTGVKLCIATADEVATRYNVCPEVMKIGRTTESLLYSVAIVRPFCARRGILSHVTQLKSHKDVGT